MKSGKRLTKMSNEELKALTVEEINEVLDDEMERMNSQWKKLKPFLIPVAVVLFVITFLIILKIVPDKITDLPH